MRAVLALLAFGLVAQVHGWNNVTAPGLLGSKDPNGAGARITVTETGLQKFMSIAIPIINSAFRTINLPNLHMDENVPVVGHITLDVTELTVHDFHINGGKAIAGAPANLAFEIGPGVNLIITANWHWRKVKWPHLSGHGSVTITPENGDIRAAISISSVAGHFHLTSVGTACNFDKFKIHFSGSEGWLLNLFVKLLANTIKKLVDTEVAKEMAVIINGKLNEVLAALPTSFTFGGGVGRMTTDISLVEAVGTPTYIDFGFPFSITSVQSGQACPIAAPPIQIVDQGATGRMLQIFLGQHFLNCALWTLFTNGALSHVITSNTSAWLLLVPAIPLKWPNAAMEEQLFMYKLGSINLAAGAGVTGDFALALNLTVLPAGGGRQHAALLGIDVHASFNVWIGTGPELNVPYLFLKVGAVTLKLSALDTAVGPIDLSLLNGLIAILSPVIVNAIDALMAGGLPLPLSHGFSLVNPQIAFFNQYLGVEADFAYNA